MDRPAQHSKITFLVGSILGAATLLTTGVKLYWLEEVLACWFFFSVAFGLMTIAAVIVVAIYCAILSIFHLVTGAARGILHARFTTPTLHPK